MNLPPIAKVMKDRHFKHVDISWNYDFVFTNFFLNKAEYLLPIFTDDSVDEGGTDDPSDGGGLSILSNCFQAFFLP